MGLADRKRELREMMAQQLRALPAGGREHAGREVARHILVTPEFESCRNLALFSALGDEVATQPLFEAAAEAGKVRLFPRCEPSAALRFFEVTEWEELSPGRYGVLEPPEGREEIALGSDDLVLVPGVAFDARGNRLGRGGGHYDRTFPPDSALLPTLFGLAFDFQVVENVPCGPRDGVVAAIVTERGVKRVEPRGKSR